MGDLALIWSEQLGSADLAVIGTDLATDEGLKTAVELSLFLDRRAEDDDVPPSGDPNDRRGWWGDEFATVEGDRYGSRLWMLDRAASTHENALAAKQYCEEALQWLLDDRVASAVDVVTEATRERLSIAVTLRRPGKDPISLRYAARWDAMN